MPIPSRWTVPVPEISVPTWLFGPPSKDVSDRQVFIDADQPNRYLTHKQWKLLSQRIALGLQRRGLQQGDRVLLFSANTIYFPAILIGVIMAGGIFTGVSPLFGEAELAYQLKDCDARFVIAKPTLLETAVKAFKRLSRPTEGALFAHDNDLTSQDCSEPGKHWTALMAEAEEAATFEWYEPADPRSTTCALNYSSGTTGLPKGVEITHYAYVANAEGGRLNRELIEAQVNKKLKPRVLCFLPLYHAGAQTQCGINYAGYGYPIYIMPAFNFEKMLEYTQRYGITLLLAAPLVQLALAKHPAVPKYDLSKVEEVYSATAPLAPDVARQVVQRIWPERKNMRVWQIWGMTEITCVGTFDLPEVTESSASVGEVAVNAQIKIMDGDKEITEPNERGELWFSGPALLKCYWRNPKATGEAVAVDADGTRWLKTGDVAYVDKSEPGARIFIVDRLKELIKVRGFQVAPAELEALLLQRPDVTDAGVVGVTINGEEMPRAYVVKTSDATEEEIIKWIEERVAKYKRLQGGVQFVEAIPRIPSGKILRRVLRERAKQEVGGPNAKV